MQSVRPALIAMFLLKKSQQKVAGKKKQKNDRCNKFYLVLAVSMSLRVCACACVRPSVHACATSHSLRDSLKPKRPSCSINKAIVCSGMDGRRPAGRSSCLLNNIKGSESRAVQSITPSLGPGRRAARAAAISRARARWMAKGRRRIKFKCSMARGRPTFFFLVLPLR